MSKEVINRNPDLQRLFAEGFEINIIGDAYLLIHSVPYVTPEMVVKRGTLVSNLYHNAGTTIKPGSHVAYFIGEHPSTSAGAKLNFVVNDSPQILNEKYTINYTLSSRADYTDHYQKMMAYIRLLQHQAQQIEPDITAATRKVWEPEEEDSIFEYADTNSAKAMINPITDKLKGQKIVVVG
ncbi:MAG TPA: DUF6791 domain-containing protein, partial [Mucilaginibacter sp.]|nr:DUF6791 domain-containing protein [Mucilaginibacter sp.]